MQSNPFAVEQHVDQFEHVEHIEQENHTEHVEFIEQTEQIENIAYDAQFQSAEELKQGDQQFFENPTVAGTEQDSDLGNDHDLEDMDSNLNPGKFHYDHRILYICISLCS